MQINVIEGCIACGVCESITPEVFTVLETSVVDNAQISGREDLCREASEACPVNVIQIVE